ncbi:hypothetical protein F4604DRAFT_1203740 [Suillus subluteus]|nr:hypothetical protein F4604DRAFT_1203740 [Suillus subluteus]
MRWREGGWWTIDLSTQVFYLISKPKSRSLMLSLHVLVLSALALGVSATALPYYDHELHHELHHVGCQTTCAAQQCYYNSDCGSSCYCSSPQPPVRYGTCYSYE